MSKFTISIGGRGCEIYVRNISEDQREKLEHLNLSECALDDVSSILEIDTFDLVSSDEIYVGAYSENSVVTVEDERGDIIFEKDIDILHISESLSDIYSVKDIYQENKIYIKDDVKGRFFQLEYEGDGFDPKKLELHFTNIEGNEVISKFIYDGLECELGDYWSKGITFFLSNE